MGTGVPGRFYFVSLARFLRTRGGGRKEGSRKGLPHKEPLFLVAPAGGWVVGGGRTILTTLDR